MLEIPIRLTNIQLPNFKFQVTILREDQILFGFGTKIRKLAGFLDLYKSNKNKDIYLWGSVHGNFLASYVFLLKQNGFLVHVISYSRDMKLKSANRIVIESNASSFYLYPSRARALAEWENLAEEKQEGDCLKLPEFGLHPTAIPGLRNLWSQLEKKIPTSKTIFLEIGSGTTFLSALDFFKNSDVVICGISVGEDRDSFLESMNQKIDLLGMSNKSLAKHYILPPLGNKKFGRKSNRDADLAVSLFKETGIFFEPIYGIRTLEYILNPDLLPQNLPHPWVYLHQGGQLNHLDLILNA